MLSLLVLWIFFCNTLSAQNLSDVKVDKTSISFAQQLVINSKILGEKRTVNLYLPESYHKTSTTHKYPVLLLLEDEFFLMVSGVVKHLSSVERMPEIIVVSLVDGPHVPKLYTNGSDFWPKDWKQIPFGKNPEPFSNHLKNELFPHLKDKFRANDFSIILGFSASSMYTLHAFVKEKNLFNAHIAIASGDILGLGYAEGERFIDLIVEDFQKVPSRKGYFYTSSSDSDVALAPKIKANLEEFESRLSHYRSTDFKFISKIFPNEGHYDLALPALSEALELIFPREKWSADYREIIKAPGNAMYNLDKYFEKLSHAYGFEILPKAERWNSGNNLNKIAAYLIKQNKGVEAIEVMERLVKQRPKSKEYQIKMNQLTTEFVKKEN